MKIAEYTVDCTGLVGNAKTDARRAVVDGVLPGVQAQSPERLWITRTHVDGEIEHWVISDTACDPTFLHWEVPRRVVEALVHIDTEMSQDDRLSMLKTCAAMLRKQGVETAIVAQLLKTETRRAREIPDDFTSPYITFTQQTWRVGEIQENVAPDSVEVIDPAL